MPGSFSQGANRMGYDGMVLLEYDDGSSTTVYALPYTNVRNLTSDNNGYPAVIDNSGLMHMKVAGIVLGSLSITSLMVPDRTLHTIMNQGFGPRSNGLLTPWRGNIVPRSGATPTKFTGAYFSTMQQVGRFGTRGDDAVVAVTFRMIILDPNNVYACPTLTAPAASGTAGAGPTSFDQMSFTDGQTVPTTYDGVRSYALALTNQMQIQPAMKDPANRIAAGCTPGPLMGTLQIGQLREAANPLPGSSGTYPIEIISPTGDQTHTLTQDVSCSWDSNDASILPLDFNTMGRSYTIFSKSAGPTTTAGWNYVASYT